MQTDKENRAWKFSAPGRTELAGNHTDHNNGKVLAAAINLEITASVQKTYDNTIFFCSCGFPDVKVKLTDEKGNPDLLPKPEETGKTEALIRGIAAEFFKRGCKVSGFSANAESAVLPGSGLSSSAAVEVLIGRIFDSLFADGKHSAVEIAQIGQIAENVYFGKPCGLMDQIACANGGAVFIDFADTHNPIVKKINFDPAAFGYTLCIVNTGGSHADLTADYASIPEEMKSAAAFFGKSVLRELDKETLLSRASDIRKKLGDRALLRSIHFFDENARVDALFSLLLEMDNTGKTASLNSVNQNAFRRYLELINESGISSAELLQNVYSPNDPGTQGISAALTLTKDFLRKYKPSSGSELKNSYSSACYGAYRVHGGGFAGTIQAYIPTDAMEAYRAFMETVFGAGCVTPLKINYNGAAELNK